MLRKFFSTKYLLTFQFSFFLDGLVYVNELRGTEDMTGLILIRWVKTVKSLVYLA